MVNNTTWLVAILLALSIYLDVIIAQIGLADAFGEPDESFEGPEGPKVNDYHNEDQPNADEKES
jgi:hypothetical protein